jgi:hypothetical protein
MGHLKMLIHERCQKVPFLGLFHGFDIFPHGSEGVFFFFVNYFSLTCLHLWFSGFGFFRHPLSAVLFEVSWESAMKANSFLFFAFGDFRDVHIHAVFGTNVWLVAFPVEQLQKVRLLLARILAVFLTQLMARFQPFALVLDG